MFLTLETAFNPPIPPRTPPVYHRNVAVVIKTNIVRTINLVWNPSSQADRYYILWGTNLGQYPWSSNVPAGSNFSLTYSRIRDRKYYFTLMASNAAFGACSVICNVITNPSPPDPPINRIELNWGTNIAVIIETSSDLFSWSIITNLTGSNVVLDLAPLPRFHRIRSWSPVKIKYRGFYQ